MTQAAAPNPVRGEVAVTIAGEQLVLRVSMEALCRFSAAIEAKTFADVWNRAVGAEPNAVFAGLRLFCVSGDVDKALRAIKFTDFARAGKAFGEALQIHAGDDPGNG